MDVDAMFSAYRLLCFFRSISRVNDLQFHIVFKTSSFYSFSILTIGKPGDHPIIVSVFLEIGLLFREVEIFDDKVFAFEAGFGCDLLYGSHHLRYSSVIVVVLSAQSGKAELFGIDDISASVCLA